MAKATFNRKIIEKEIKLDEKTLERISLFGTAVEQLTETELVVEVSPNRPDLLSTRGFLRAIKAFLSNKPKITTYQVKSPAKDMFVKIDPSVNSVRPYTVCAIVKGLTFNDDKIKEIIDIQEKLHATLGRNRKKLAIGVYPLEKITLPITYEARTPDKILFIPLEETKEMNGLQILQRHPTGREYAHLLEGKDKFPVFVDAKGKIMSMPPIINSHETGKITEQTKDVFIECSGFHRPTLEIALNILVTSLAEMSGTIYAVQLKSGKNKEQTPNLKPLTIKVDLNKINSLLGLNLKEKELSALLAKMGHEYKKGTVKYPSWRSDILHWVDIAEDTSIAYGYDKLVPEIPKVSTIGEANKLESFKETLARILVGLGLQEISTFHLIKPDEAKLSKSSNKIELKDSKTDYKLLRQNLTIPMLRILSENKDKEYPQNLFEIGRVFSEDKSEETGIHEEDKVIISLCPSNVTNLKQVLDSIFAALGKEFKISEKEVPYCIDGRSAEILINNKTCGVFGELHPETLKSWGIKMPVALAEFSLSALI